MQQDVKSKLIPTIQNVIPVASGKGGVGKSTVSVNLAIALSKQGFRVGLMDGDIYGPSLPALMGARQAPVPEGEKIVPSVCYGIKLISMGFFIPKERAVIWRGPMLAKTIHQFLGSVAWGELDYLIIDLPPGTGDVQLSLCQTIALTGAVIVSTPQDLAFDVAEKAILMFQQLHVPILGLIENMSGYVCSKCGHQDAVFGKGGVEQHAASEKIPYLGSIPLSTEIRTTSDQGCPIVEGKPNSAGAKPFLEIAQRVVAEVKAQSEAKIGARQLEPQEITEPSKSEVRILWKDGHESLYRNFDLRLACTCAQCVDEVTGARRLTADAIRLDVHPHSIKRVGNYALQFMWSDGHSTGLYSFDYLRKLGDQGDSPLKQ